MKKTTYKSRPPIIRAIQRIYGARCMRCGWEEARCDVHHIVPVRHGGEHSLDNVVVLCPNCHRLAETGILNADEVALVRLRATPLEKPLSAEAVASVRGQKQPPRSRKQNIIPHGYGGMGRKRTADGSWRDILDHEQQAMFEGGGFVVE